MKVGDSQDLLLQKHEHVVCKFLECVKVDMEFSENQHFTKSKSLKPALARPQTTGRKKWYNDYSPDKKFVDAEQQLVSTNYLGDSSSEDLSVELDQSDLVNE